LIQGGHGLGPTDFFKLRQGSQRFLLPCQVLVVPQAKQNLAGNDAVTFANESICDHTGKLAANLDPGFGNDSSRGHHLLDKRALHDLAGLYDRPLPCTNGEETNADCDDDERERPLSVSSW